MDILIGIYGITALHCSLFFLDFFLKSCSHYPYFYFLENTGLQISPFRIGWFTTSFNKLIKRIGLKYSRFLNIWFWFGKIISVTLLPVSVVLLIKSIFELWEVNNNSEGNNSPTITLEPIIPGVNLPLSDLGYYSLSLAICSITHELGHAFAAVREGVQTLGFGCVLFFIIPFAYVELHSDQLSALPPIRQLSVLCAGVWHNIVVAFISLALLLSLPYLAHPFYETNSGIYITQTQSNSPIVGERGIENGDIVVSLNACNISNKDSWIKCIILSMQEPQTGFCIEPEFIKLHKILQDEKHINGNVCCKPDDIEGFCFLHYNVFDRSEPQTSFCLPARLLIESSKTICKRDQLCSKGLDCVIPVVENNTKVVHIKRHSKSDVIFVGHPAEIYHSLVISDFVPRASFLSPKLPESLEKLLWYVSVFSPGLALLNIIPCFKFDGQWIINAFCELFSNAFRKSVRKQIAYSLTWLGTILLLGYIICVLYIDIIINF